MEEDKDGNSEAVVAMEVKDLRSWCLIHMVIGFRLQSRESGSFISLTVICVTSSLCFPGESFCVFGC